jgi:hypothetical protein
MQSRYKIYWQQGDTTHIKGIVSPDWKGLQMVSLDRFEVYRIPLYVYF